MLLSYTRLVEECSAGLIYILDDKGEKRNIPLEHINGASVDVTLGNIILLESNERMASMVDLSIKDSNPCFRKIDLNKTPNQCFDIYPGGFFLASTREVFHLPNDIAAEYKLKSTLARKGLQHLFAGFCDPGWNGSNLTLEFKNVLQNHNLRIRLGMKCGQIKFHQVATVPASASYASRGQYNKRTGPAKGEELK